MNAINKAISEVYFNIPLEILNIGFNDNPMFPGQSLDEVIMSRVIRPRVLVDCNIVGGIEVYLPISKCYVNTFDNGHNIEHVVDVPNYLIGGKSIISAIGLFSGTITGDGGNNDLRVGDKNLTNSLLKQMTHVAPVAPLSTARLELIGENKILIDGPTNTIFVNSLLKCVVENNNDLSNIPPRAYHSFSNLVVLAVKAYIHNYLIVKLGQGYIYNGHELGVINDIVSEYSSANEEYRTFLTEKWTQVAFHSDKTRLANFISGMI